MLDRLNLPLPWDAATVEALAQGYFLRAAQDFAYFRKLMRPTLIENWWTDEIAEALQDFYDDLIAGRRPRLVIGTGPQHGKSLLAGDFIAWVAGKNPDLKTIFASYSDDLGNRANLTLQRMVALPQYRETFPGTTIGGVGWQCNSSLIEFVDRAGSFRNTTIGGSINGMELHLGVIDDPVKGRAEAQSPTTREKIWNWYTDDFGSRFAANAGMLTIMTRWHVDDMVGRILEHDKSVRVLAYPAIAEEDEEFRRKGEALLPELKPLEFLLERKKVLSQASWESLYQQHPIIVGGGLFPIEKIGILAHMPISEVVKSVRYVDKASTEDGGAYTACVMMHKLKDGRFVVEDVRRGQWGALERELHIKQTAQRDQIRYPHHWIYVEQEPGSGGKESAENTVRMLAGFKVAADRVTGDKVFRADPFAAQVQAGNVLMVAGEWNQPYLDEMEQFPAGKFLDQVDASSGAFNKLTLESTYDSSLAWIGQPEDFA